MTTTQTIDLDLVDQTVALIPKSAWFYVRQIIVNALIDNMPGSALKQLTGSYDAFEKAEQILTAYYEIPSYEKELIIDAFKILGTMNALEMLDAANLEQFIDNDISSTNAAEVSAMQGEQTQDN